MRYQPLLLFLLFPVISVAQPDFETMQQQWVQKIKNSASVNSYRWENGSLLFFDAEAEKTDNLTSLFKNRGITNIGKYQQINVFKHDNNRYLTVGTITADKNDLLLLTGWRKVNEGWKKEVDVILVQKSSGDVVSDKIVSQLNSERRKWIELANKHNPSAHIAYSYTPDAIYFSNGRQSDGHDRIAERYAYMKNPNYRVDLEKKYLRQISAEKIVEVGRYYAGNRENNPGGLYTILWAKTGDERWMIALDFNF